MVRHNYDIQLCQTVAAGGETLKYQVLKTPALPRIELLEGRTDREILEKLRRLTVKHLLPKTPQWDNFHLFTPPPEPDDPFPVRDGEVFLPRNTSRIRYWLEKYRAEGELDAPLPSAYLGSLAERGLLLRKEGGGSNSMIIPVYPKMTRLSRHYARRRATVNTHFFLMEIADIPTPWDMMGEPFGLCLLEGRVLLPPLYRREALTWSPREGGRTELLGIRDFAFALEGRTYRDGENARFFLRPETAVTPEQKGTDLVIVGNRLEAWKHGGGTPIPQGGFVCHLPSRLDPGEGGLTFLPPRRWDFAIQVGPSLVKEGEILPGFSTPMYQGRGISYPPTSYPLDWAADRAARTGIGFQGDRMILICVEGSKAQVYRPGKDSTGASLAEFARLCADQKVQQMVNLDGGGSAQMSVYGKRSLKMSDRHKATGEDFERPVPLGLGIELP